MEPDPLDLLNFLGQPIWRQLDDPQLLLNNLKAGD